MKKLAVVFVYFVGIGLILGSASAPIPPRGKARFVLIEGNQGIIALPRGEADRPKAMYMINQRCPNGSVIVKEAEEVVGQMVTEYEGEKSTYHEKTGERKIVKQNKMEYRIYFECR